MKNMEQEITQEGLEQIKIERAHKNSEKRLKAEIDNHEDLILK